jgi:glycosyltransferase involved in cell wall biosynthesis
MGAAIMNYSVLMSIYHKEHPDYFQISVESMLNQTIPPNEIVIVKDGPLSSELEIILNKLKKDHRIKVISFEKNQGLGKALEVGLLACENEFIARMDTDDISKENRCEKQLALFYKDPKLSLVGTSISEFIDEPTNIVSFRRVPEEDHDIKKYMKTRSPFNHPSVMFRKSEVLKSGNYKHWNLNEDYYLWIRMLLNNCKFANIDEPLLNMRINEDTFLRRGGWAYFITQKRLFDFMLKHKIINLIEYSYNNIVRFITRLLIPNKTRMWVYSKLLRH